MKTNEQQTRVCICHRAHGDVTCIEVEIKWSLFDLSSDVLMLVRWIGNGQILESLPILLLHNIDWLIDSFRINKQEYHKSDFDSYSAQQTQ
jgi:hypothetical protein